ncbi:MAG: hypothetical protein FVQ83_15495 [Chloroflexi bacterium]|nr:hypothetical protein [Chloroflexota bacterium]
MPQSEKKSQASFSERIYKKLIFLYPTAYKRKYAALMQQMFKDLYRDAQSGKTRFGLYNLWARVLLDFAASAIEEYFSEVFQMKRRKFSRLASIIAALGGILTIIIIFSNWDESPYPFPMKDELANQTFTEQSIPIRFDPDPWLLINETNAEKAETGINPLSLSWRVLELTPEGTQLIPINGWQATPASFILPLLWFSGLVSLFIWARAGKLGISGFSAGVVGCLMMAASMFQSSRSVEAETTWTLFSWGVFLLGGGLATFGLGAVKSKALPRWNALPLVMGLLIVSLEASNRWLPTDVPQPWIQIQGVVLLLFGISWVMVGYILFANKPVESKPA